MFPRTLQINRHCLMPNSTRSSAPNPLMSRGKKRPWIHQVLVFFLFAGITLVMTYPAVLIGDRAIIGDYGDSLFNSWILSWDVHKITSGELLSLFQANIFYPHKNTLAYSEHMLGNVPFVIPVILFTQNPVLAYNVLFLISLTLSGFTMYLLSYYLSGNRSAALVSGLIFAYFPWRFAHLSHVQLQAAQWIPLTFLYLHRFVNEESYKTLFLFTLFFVLEFLSCGYYGLFLSIFVGLFLFLDLITRRPFRISLWAKLGLFALLSGLVILPTYYPYIQVKKEMGFVRSLGEVVYFSADLASFISTTSLNRLWGGVTQSFWRPEGELFLGLTPLFLGLVGILVTRRKKDRRIKGELERSSKKMKTLSGILNILLGLSGVMILIILLFGGLSTNLWGVKISATSLNRVVWIFLILIGLKSLLSFRRAGGPFAYLPSFTYPGLGFYFLMLILSFLFCFGPFIHLKGREMFFYSPYLILYQFFPGFDGLRVPSRFIILIACSVSVFAGFGLAWFLARSRVFWQKLLLVLAAVTFIIAEYASFPLFMVPVPTGKEVPQVFRWLAHQKGDFAILELPLPSEPAEVWKEAFRVYYSTYHWKKLVNGYSGYFPPDYDLLYQKGLKGFPSDSSVAFLGQLDVKYVIIHFGDYDRPAERELVFNRIDRYRDLLRPVARFGSDFVYEINKGSGRAQKS